MSVRPIQATFIAGTVIFGVMFLLTSAVFVYFVWKGYQFKEMKRAAGESYHYNWLNSMWIYPALATIFLFFTVLYCFGAVQMGFTVLPSLEIAFWLRWLVLAIIGWIAASLLAFIMTKEQRDDPMMPGGKYHEQYQHFLHFVQPFFIVFFYAFSYILIFIATFLAVDNVQKIVSMTFSAIFFVISILLFFFPYNKIGHMAANGTDTIYFTPEDVTGVSTGNNQKRVRRNIILTYRLLWLFIVVISYVLYFIIWFLSKSNGFSDAIHFRNEFIAYLIIDFLSIVPWAIVLMVFTFYFKQKTMGYIEKETDGGPIKPPHYNQQFSLGVVKRGTNSAI
jgi:hypothetical protein